mgnify:CR=1 FL=1
MLEWPTADAQPFRALLAHPKVVPMAQKTRQLTEQFYAPYNQKLATLLDDAALTWPEGSAVVGADEEG